MVRLSLPESGVDLAGRCAFQCDGCGHTFVDIDEKVNNRTYDYRTYCPECWKLGEFESDYNDEIPKNQIY